MAQLDRVSGAASPPPTLSTTVPGSEAHIPALISDGKRMRTIWRPEHGDGEYVPHIVERSKTTLCGHPTWKLFVNDIVQPFIRGSKQEPPHCVYLDDEACYIVWKSRQYTNTELKTFWPFDFDHQGNIKTGRPNRGRPAWVDSDMPVIAKGELRGKNKWYTFSGEPETTGYRPSRPVSKTKVELQVEAEWAAQNRQDTGVVSSTEKTLSTPASEMSTNNITIPGSTPIAVGRLSRPGSPLAARTTRLDRACASRASPPRHAPPKQTITAERSTSKDSIKLRNSQSHSVQDSLLDDLSHYTEDSSMGVSQPNLLSNVSTSPPKHKPANLFLVSSSRTKSTPKLPDHKHAKMAGLPLTITGANLKHKPAGPFLISSPSKNSLQPSNHKRITSTELQITPAGAIPNDKQGTRGEHQSSSLPVQLLEYPLDVDSDCEEDEFLARKSLDSDTHSPTLTLHVTDINQTLKRKR